jgi:hypothetical protein
MNKKLRLLAVAAALAAVSSAALAQTAVIQSLNNVVNRAATYSAVAAAFTLAATPTDVCILNGSATKTIYVTKVSVSGLKTTAGLSQVVLAKRSVANTGGTAVAGTEVPSDSSDAAATGTFQHYTANPTPGALVGNIYQNYMLFAAPAGTTDGVMREVFFSGANMTKPIRLSGVAEGLAVNLAGATLTGGTFNCTFEWIER